METKMTAFLKSTRLFALLVVATTIAGCSVTNKAPMKEDQLNCAFLGADCSRLTPGGKDQAGYRYIAPNVQWTQYNKILIQPVTFWAAADCTLSSQDQQMLVNFFQSSLQKQLAKNFQIVTTPQAGAMTLQVALVDASTATPFLRSVSMIIPQLHLLASLKNMATGSYPFVGGAQAEMKLTDSMTGSVLAEAADRRLGGGAFQTGFQWQWGDAENICTAWTNMVSTRLASWTSGKQTP